MKLIRINFRVRGVWQFIILTAALSIGKAKRSRQLTTPEKHSKDFFSTWGASMCQRKTEVYSRVVGFYRPINVWNLGKQAEYKTRKEFIIKKDGKDTDIIIEPKQPIS